MSVIGELLALESFRVALNGLARLSERRADELVQLAQMRGHTASPHEIPVEDRDAYAVTLSLADVIVRDGTAEVVDHLRAEYEAEAFKRLEQVVTQLEPTDEQRKDALVRSVQTSALPVLISHSIDLDFRLARPVTGDSPVLVPVAIVRLEFDEAIAGASQAVVFQLPDREMTTLSDELAGVATLLRQGPQLVSAAEVVGFRAEKPTGADDSEPGEADRDA